MSDSIARPLARRLRSGDSERLAGFTCSNGAWYEVEGAGRTRNAAEVFAELEA